MTDQPPAWVGDAVFYQIFPDRFARSKGHWSSPYGEPAAFEDWAAPPTVHGYKGGDLYGVAERLDELADLGINALYLNPIFSSASNHRYHAYDYLAVDPLLGGDAALRELIDQAHARQIRVVLDGVFNHAGRGFWPFHHVLEAGAQSPYRDWFLLDQEVRGGKRALNAYPRGTGPAEPALGYQAWWNLPALPKLNVSNPATAEYLWTVGEHWLKFGIDGWRLDVPDEIDVPGFWETFRERCLAVRSDCYLVGEIWEHKPDWMGNRFDGLMAYPLGAAILGFASGQHLHAATISAHHTYNLTIRKLDPAGFGAALERAMTVYPQPNIEAQLTLIGSHDTPRVLNVMDGNVPAVRQAMLLLLTLPGAPNVYYGDEIGMEGGDDPDCRRAFPEDPQAGDRELRAYVRALVGTRKDNPALRRGTARVVATGATSVAILRESAGQRAVVALNPSGLPDRVSLPSSLGLGGLDRLTLAGDLADGVALAPAPDGSVEIQLGPQRSLVATL